MGNRKPYNTKQKELILEVVKQRPQDYLTIQDLMKELQSRGCKVGLTTIYRNLEKLESEGSIAKVSIEGMAGACYRCLPEEPDGVLFCLKCETCGSIVELDCPELSRLYQHIASDHGFAVNAGKTMFYGTCSACAGND